MFERLAGRVNAPVVIVDERLRQTKLRNHSSMVLEQGGFGTVYQPYSRFSDIAQHSVCAYTFNEQTRDLIRRDHEFPVIMIDDRVLQYLLDEEIEAAVAHEIAHVAHGDYYKNLPMDPMHPARMVIELEADKASAEVMGSPDPVINMISKLRYLLPQLLATIGLEVQETNDYVRAIDARIAALVALQV